MKRKQSLINATSGSFIKRNHSAGSGLGKVRNASTGSLGNGYARNGGLPDISGALQNGNGTVANGNGPFKTRHLSLANMKTWDETRDGPQSKPLPYAMNDSPRQGRPVFTLAEEDSPPMQDSPRRASSMKDSPKRSVSTTNSPGIKRVPSKTRHLSLGNIKLKPEERESLRTSSTGDKPRRFSLASLTNFRSRRASSEDSFSLKPPMSLKIRKLINGSWAFGITSFLMVIFGVTVLVENLHVQVRCLFYVCLSISNVKQIISITQELLAPTEIVMSFFEFLRQFASECSYYFFQESANIFEIIHKACSILF